MKRLRSKTKHSRKRLRSKVKKSRRRYQSKIKKSRRKSQSKVKHSRKKSRSKIKKRRQRSLYKNDNGKLSRYFSCFGRNRVNPEPEIILNTDRPESSSRSIRNDEIDSVTAIPSSRETITNISNYNAEFED